MNRILLSLVLVITLMNFTFAIETYAGGCYNLTFPNSEEVFFNEIEGDFTGFSWTQNESIITYCFSEDFKPQVLRMQFYNDGYEKDVIVNEVIRTIGGGGGGTKYVDRNITQYVEVPKIIEKEVQVEVEKEVIKEIPIEENKEPLLLEGLIILFIIIVTCLIYNYRTERRSNKNE